MMDEIKRLNFPVDRQLHKRIRLAAAVTEKTVPTLLRELIDSGLTMIEETAAETPRRKRSQ